MADNGRYRDIYNFIGRKKAGDDFAPSVLVDEIRALLRDFGIPGSLSAAGVTAEKIPLMAADAMKSGNILANPRQSTIQDVERLYLSAL